MSGRDARAGDWKAVKEIRRLQSRSAEMAAQRAGAERGAAAERHSEAEAALGEAQRGWTAAVMGRAFDPGLVGRWYAEVGRNLAGEREAGETLREADRTLDARRADWHAAEARAEVAGARHDDAVARAVRRRDEARLAEGEDRFARQGKPG